MTSTDLASTSTEQSLRHWKKFYTEHSEWRFAFGDSKTDEVVCIVDGRALQEGRYSGTSSHRPVRTVT